MVTGSSPSIPGSAGARLPRLARASVESALNGAAVPPPRSAEAALADRRGVFVTLHESDGRLRGCVGTLSPRFHDVLEETWHMAREAAFHDSRFPPVRSTEVPRLRFEVSVVQPLENIPDASDLDPTRFGVVVSTLDGRRGALLPAVPGIDTVAHQLAIARKKGGIQPLEPVRLQRFRVEHYTETDAPPGPASPAVVTTL